MWVEGRNPKWYTDTYYQIFPWRRPEEDRYMNAEVISVERDGAILLMWDDGSTEHFDRDFFVDKDYHPDDGGYGVWKIRY